jgi:hypothetical protein
MPRYNKGFPDHRVRVNVKNIGPMMLIHPASPVSQAMSQMPHHVQASPK